MLHMCKKYHSYIVVVSKVRIVIILVRKSFYFYCFLLAVLNSFQTVGCAMLHFANIPAGWWYVDHELSFFKFHSFLNSTVMDCAEHVGS